MQTPIKNTYTKLNTSSFSPFSNLASSKASTHCDFQRDQSSSLQKKKFARKRQNSNDSLKRFRGFQGDRKLKKKQNIQTSQNIEESFHKADNLLQKLTLKKQSMLETKYVKLYTDRSYNDSDFQSMNSSFLVKSRCNNSSRIKTLQSEMSVSTNDYKMQFEMKQQQIMILQDENTRLKKQLKTKQNQVNKMERQVGDLRSEYQSKIKFLGQRVKKLQTQIVSKDQMIQKNQKNKLKEKQLLRKADNQIQLLKIHLDQLMNKKLPKNTLEVISFRQASLQNRISQITKQLSLSKSERSRQLQSQIMRMKQKLCQINHQNSSLQVANRILVKKSQQKQSEVSIDKKVRNEINDLKQKMKQMMKQCSTLKKENMNLRKTIFEYQKKYEKSQYLVRGGENKRTNRLWSNIKKPLQNNTQNWNENGSDDSISFQLSR